jgi:succinoglycan biosynthesis transport protein ExoP
VKAESAVGDQAEVRLRELEREAAATRSLYESFLARFKETQEQHQILQPDARVISPAQVPDRPSSPSVKLFAAVGLITSLVCGGVLALLLEQLDRSMRTGAQVERLLRVPALGLVPKVTGLGRDDRLHAYILQRPRSAFAEGIRGLYTQTRLAPPAGDRPPGVILVTSALPGEGKTTVAASLAAFAADLQHGTLLIDLDLRRPSVANEFAMRPEVGVVEVVAGEVRLEDAVYRDESTGLDFLLMPSSHANATAPLTPERLGAVLREARGRYDYVVVDSPPLLGVSDAKTLATLVDATIFVIRWEHTKQDAAVAAMKELRDVAANVAGAVLTQVDMKRHARLGYGDAGQYYSRYKKYYEN